MTAALPVLLLAACTGDGAGEVVVEMYDDFFEPDLVHLEPGQAVRFVNRGHVAHNAHDLDGAWRTGDLGPGQDEEVTVADPGSYRFYCSFHATSDGAGMAGTLLAGEEAAAPDVDTQPPVTAWTGVTRAVPEDHRTIQEAVDAADPGDLVLVGPGTYREQVEVSTPSVTIRGTDRNRVVVDGQHRREMGVIVTADGVAVENLTVRDALANGVYWRGVTGFRGSYLTAIGNVGYGIYAFDSTDGLFEHSYASGSADGGFYVGQCRPCRIVLDRVTAEHNGLGYSGTNAGGDLYVVRSTWQHNGAGIVPNTLDSQRDPPARRPALVGNVVRANGNRDVAHLPGTWPALGGGIVLAGVRDAVVERNLVVDNAHYGILVTANLDDRFWPSGGNVVRGNVVRGSGRADLALAGPAAGGNCWDGNDAAHSTPWGLEATQPCDGWRVPRLSLGTTFTLAGHVASRPDIPDLVARVAAQPEPGPLAQMPRGADAGVRPAHDVYAGLDLDVDAVELPGWDGGAGDRRTHLLMGVPVVSGTGWEVALGLLGTAVPLAIWLRWVSAALGDLRRRDDLSRAGRWAWGVTAVAVPPAGVLAYLVAGGSHLGRWRRLAMVGGGVVGWVALVAAAALAGGLV